MVKSTTSEAPNVGAIADLQAENRRLVRVVGHMIECFVILAAAHPDLSFPELPKEESE